jgi:hypothetical protein
MLGSNDECRFPSSRGSFGWRNQKSMYVAVRRRQASNFWPPLSATIN